MLIFLIVFIKNCESVDEIYLENFDQRILKELLCPVTNNGQYLYQTTLQYYSNLLDMMKMIESDNRRVKEHVKSLIKDGGPKILTHSINSTVLKEAYDWNQDQFFNYKSVYDKVRDLWDEIVQHVPVKKDESDSSDNYSYSSSDSHEDYDWRGR